MPHLKLIAVAYLSATFSVVAGCQLFAFEQGTYFIYQLVEKSDDPVIAKRLVLDRDLFVKVETAQTHKKPDTTERSEFEMDYNSLGTSAASSSFGTTQATTTSDTSRFDIATPETGSLFGN